MSHVEQDLFTLPEHLRPPPVFSLNNIYSDKSTLNILYNEIILRIQKEAICFYKSVSLVFGRVFSLLCCVFCTIICLFIFFHFQPWRCQLFSMYELYPSGIFRPSFYPDFVHFEIQIVYN